MVVFVWYSNTTKHFEGAKRYIRNDPNMINKYGSDMSIYSGRTTISKYRRYTFTVSGNSHIDNITVYVYPSSAAPEQANYSYSYEDIKNAGLQ